MNKCVQLFPFYLIRYKFTEEILGKLGETQMHFTQ